MNATRGGAKGALLPEHTVQDASLTRVPGEPCRAVSRRMLYIEKWDWQAKPGTSITRPTSIIGPCGKRTT